MRITERQIRQIIREEARQVLREGSNSNDREIMKKFVEAQREVAPKFRNIYGQKPYAIDTSARKIYNVVDLINDDHERVRFNLEEYMEALKSAMQDRGVMIKFEIDRYDDVPLTRIEVVESENNESEDDEDGSKHL